MRGDLLLLVIEETRRNLAAKAPGVLPAFQLLTEVVALETVQTPEASLVLDVAKTIELKDAPIVAAAIVGGADYLATHDAKHLLSQAEIARVSFGLIIVTPGDVLRDMRA